jgi:MFS-type transporter involved in bile tolerance (Atg22 family)
LKFEFSDCSATFIFSFYSLLDRHLFIFVESVACVFVDFTNYRENDLLQIYYLVLLVLIILLLNKNKIVTI